MNTYDFISGKNLSASDIDNGGENLIITDKKNLERLGQHFNIPIKEIMEHNDDFPVFFIPGTGYDLFTFVFLNESRKRFSFESITLILLDNNLIIDINNKSLYKDLVDEFLNKNAFNSITTAYFYFMELAFAEMFSHLCEYEEHLNYIEAQLIIGSKEYKISDIIREKNSCLKIKKYSRLLYCSGEDLKLNLNSLVPEAEAKLLKNISAKISLLHEMSNHIYEICAHLLEVYDSTVNTKTNNAINKLTVFNFFATPITIISGIYGMNFVNMPELRNPYGYFIVLGIMVACSFGIYQLLKKLKLL